MLCGHLEHVILVVPCRAVPYLTKRRMKLHAFLAQGLAYSVRRVGVDVGLLGLRRTGVDACAVSRADVCGRHGRGRRAFSTRGVVSHSYKESTR